MKDINELAVRVSADVYAAAVKHFEEAEHAGLIIGNGHHMAQDIAEKAKDLLLERHLAATLAQRNVVAHRCEEECCLPK